MSLSVSEENWARFGSLSRIRAILRLLRFFSWADRTELHDAVAILTSFLFIEVFFCLDALV